MFIHVFKYRLKVLVRDRSLIFWTLLFPLVLAVLFKVTFSGLGQSENFDPIPVGVINNSTYQQDASFQGVIKAVSTGEKPFLAVKVMSLEEGQQSLKEGKIKGYILSEAEAVASSGASGSASDSSTNISTNNSGDNQWSLVVKSSGISQSIVKAFLDQYSQSQAAMYIAMASGTVNIEDLISAANQRIQYTSEVAMTEGKMDMALNYFYGLLAMACMYGAFFGTQEVNQIQANISHHAARINLAPVHKLKLFLYSGSAGLLIQFVQMLILLSFIVGILGIDFGNRTGWIALTLFMGSFVGVSFGAFISAVVVGSESLKLAITLTVSMLGSMLSGMMFSDVKYLVSTHAPILQYINPVNLIADAFYSLYYFTAMDRYFTNLTLLGVFAVIFSLGTYFLVRGRKYASL